MEIFHVRSCSCPVNSEKFRTNWAEYCTMPSNYEHNSDTFCGGAIFSMASSLFGDALIPSLENVNLKNSILGNLNRHFLRLKVRPHSRNLLSRRSNALAWSAMVLFQKNSGNHDT